MQFTAQGAPGAAHKTDVFLLFRPEGTRGFDVVPDTGLRRAAQAAAKAGEFHGKKGELLLLHGGARGMRLLLVGLGPRKEADAQALRHAAGTAAREVEARGLRHATILVPGLLQAGEAARALVEGVGLAAYRFDELKSKREKPRFTRAAVAPEKGAARSIAPAVREGAAIVEAVHFARDLGNLPGNLANAVYLAKRARELHGGKLTVKIHDRAGITRLKMGAFGAVAQASHNEPRLIEMRYRGAGSKAPTFALVGKGVTFDTGGISIKPSAQMEEMKFDMCGGAAVLGLMHLVKKLKPALNLHALVPATDNMPDGAAYRPGDIVKARNGKSIEIISTDAEGRLLLCDALAYAAESKPVFIVDLATLTGACVVALGDAAAGLFASDDGLRKRLEAAATRSGDPVWPMPIFPSHLEAMQSPYADLKNAGGRWGGACTAAAFLREFVAGVPWAHLDIAGVAWTDKDQGTTRKGATGYGVRLLWELLRT